MAQDFNALARTILDKVGGEKNVAQVTHCMTRLRFNLKDESKAVPDDEMKAVKGVLGVVRSGGQYQVIIGQTGVFEGDLTCKQAEISGVIKGSIKAEELTALKSTSKVEVDLTTKQLLIEVGALFTGKCVMGQSSTVEMPKQKMG